MQDDDLTLLRRYVDEGREEAFTQVVRRNMDLVYSVALRRVGGDAHLAKDVAQDVFIALARHAGSLARHRRLAGWLYTATRNAAANRVRGEVRRRGREQEAQTMHETLPATDPGAVWSEVAPVLDSSLDGLPGRDREALLLRFFHQQTFAEVGASLRITEDAARMRVERALGRLRLQLAGRGVGSTTALLATAMSQHAVSAAPVELAGSAGRAALAAPVSPAARVLDFLVSFRPAELAVLTVALLVMGGALATGREARLAAGLAVERRLSLPAADGTNAKPVETAGRYVPAAIAAASAASAAPAAPVRPAGRDLRLAGGRRTEMAATYDPLYRALGLTAEQIERFETALLPALNSALWVFDHPVGAAERDANAATETEARLKALLGESGYRQFQEYSRLVPARQAVRQVASAVYLSEPMSRENGDELTALLTAASRTYQAGGEVRLADLDWDGLLTSARPLLSSGQLAALAAVRQRVVFQETLLRRLGTEGKP